MGVYKNTYKKPCEKKKKNNRPKEVVHLPKTRGPIAEPWGIPVEKQLEQMFVIIMLH